MRPVTEYAEANIYFRENEDFRPPSPAMIINSPKPIASSSMIRLENEIEKSLLEASDSIISETSLKNSDFVKNNNLTKITKSNKVIIMKFVKLWEASYIIYIFPIHTFVNIPALIR